MGSPYQLGAYHIVNKSNYEPQRTNNFEVQITGLNSIVDAFGNAIASNAGEVITLATDTYTAPQINISTITVRYGNNSVKYAGVPEFPDSSITLNDYIGLNVERILSAWHSKAYNPLTQKVGYAADYKKKAVLIEYDPKGVYSRQWNMYGCWLSTFNLGEFSQEGGAVRKLTASLVYDYIEPEQNSAAFDADRHLGTHSKNV